VLISTVEVRPDLSLAPDFQKYVVVVAKLLSHPIYGSFARPPQRTLVVQWSEGGRLARQHRPVFTRVCVCNTGHAIPRMEKMEHDSKRDTPGRAESTVMDGRTCITGCPESNSTSQQGLAAEKHQECLTIHGLRGHGRRKANHRSFRRPSPKPVQTLRIVAHRTRD
jgi:hypothetical protein